MNPGIKAQWTAALRSGEFSQGRGYLNADNKFCCLGVLSELAYRAGAVSRRAYSDVTCYGDNEASTAPPIEVLEWADASSMGAYGSIPHFGGTEESEEIGSLVGLNDDTARLTFPQIADVIDYFF